MKGDWLYFTSFVLLYLGTYSVQPITFLSVYFISHYSYVSSSLKVLPSAATFMEPIITLFCLFSILISGVLDRLVGIRLTLNISSSIVVITAIFYFFFENFIMYAIGIGTIGVGIGLILIATKYMVFFFPGREGTFAALGRGIGYCFMYGWYYLAEYIINPDGKEQDTV